MGADEGRNPAIQKTTDRHGGFPTTDIPVRDVPGLAELAGPLLQSSIGK